MDENKNRNFDNNDLYTGDLYSSAEIGSGQESGNEEAFDLNSFSSKAADSFEPEKRKRKAKKGPKSKKESILKILLSVFLIGTITCCLVVAGFLIYIFCFVDYSMIEDLDDLTLNFTTTIYYKDTTTGEFLEYQRLHGGDNRIWISDAKGEIPQDLKDAFVAIEDQHFYDHDGVDWKRTFGAFVNQFIKVRSKFGGSTITQQLVKNLTGDNSQKASRKIREIMRAHYLESNNSKDDILECYINTVAMANGMYGAEVASNYYFDKSASELSLAECATLAAIANLPEYYRPDTKPENNKQRRLLVLKEMYNQGFISEEEYIAAQNEEVVIVAKRENLKEAEVYSYFVDTVIEDVVDGLVEKYGYDRTYAETNFFNGGYQIYSTLNIDAQNAVDTAISDKKFQLKNGTQLLQGSITVMDYEGHIVAIGGGLGQKTENRGFNRATMAVRQPGSTMKPIAAYAPAIENNLITYSSYLNDTKKTYGDGWYPVNWYDSYWGTVSAHYALERSINTIPVYLVESLTPKKSFDFLTKKLGITTLNDEDLNFSALGMGGSSGGLCTMESAAAYATFGNLGKYYVPTTYYEVRDQHGEVILTNVQEPVVAMSEDTATIMNYMLRNVVYGGNGTGTASAAYIPHMRIYAKTGTSDATNDLWFVGGTPYYVASAWCGYDTQAKVSNEGIALRLWGDVMSKIHSNLPTKKFTDSSFVTNRYYCTQTGLLATETCPSKGIGWYKTSYMPTCTTHKGKLLGKIEYVEPVSSTASTTSDASQAQDGDTSQATDTSGPENTTTE